MRHIILSWLAASCLVAALAAQAAAAEPPAGAAREWNIQIHPGPTAPHPTAVSPQAGNGTTARDPIMTSDQTTGSNSLSENLGRGGRFYFGRGNRFANNANGISGTGASGVGSKKTGAGAPSLKGSNTPPPIASQPSPLRNHPRLAQRSGSGNRKQSILRDSYFVGTGRHGMSHRDGVLRDSNFIHGGSRSLGGPASGVHGGGGHGGGGHTGGASHPGAGHIGGKH